MEATTFGPKNETDRVVDVKNPLLPQYDGVIPQRNTKFVSYDLNLVDLRQLLTAPTRLESTTAVVAIGHDVFGARIMPEGNFDRLHENFKGTLLFATISGLVVALYAAQLYIKSKEGKEAFLTR